MTSAAATCMTCRHWGAFTSDADRGRVYSDDPEQHAEDVAFGDVVAIKRMGLCQRIGDEKQNLDAEAVAVDGSGYYAGLRTAATFGCTLHEPKEGA